MDLLALAADEAERQRRRRQQPSRAVPRFATPAAADAVAAALRDCGAVIVEGLVAPSQADHVAADLRPHFDAVGFDDVGSFNGYKTKRVYEVLARSPASAELIAPPQLLDIIDGVLLPFCQNYRIGSCSAVEILPGEEAQVLHRDDGVYPLRLPGVELQVSVLWALTDFTELNGGTRVVPGSCGNSAARLEVPRSSRGSGFTQPDTLAAVMPKGSALLYLGSTHHSGGANRSDEPRMGLVNTYALGWLRQEENHLLAIPRHLARGLPPRVRELMGYSNHGNALGLAGYYDPQRPEQYRSENDVIDGGSGTGQTRGWVPPAEDAKL